MKLIKALESGVSIRLICNRCTARQPAYVHLMIEEHGPDIELNEALKLTPCFFCEAKGDLTVIISNVE